MLNKIIVLLFIVSFLPSCKKDTISFTGGIELLCIDDYFLGANYSVHTENDFINNSGASGNLSLKSGTILQTTIVDDLNPGIYIIYFYKAGWSENIYKAVQVTSGINRKYNLSIYNH